MSTILPFLHFFLKSYDATTLHNTAEAVGITTRLHQDQACRGSPIESPLQGCVCQPASGCSQRKCHQSDGSRWTFVHIPKTGGESMEEFLGLPKLHISASSRLLCDTGNKTLKNPSCSKGGSVWFTVVRNPFARIWSWFRFCIHGHLGSEPKCAFCRFIMHRLPGSPDDWDKKKLELLGSSAEKWAANEKVQKWISPIFLRWFEKARKETSMCVTTSYTKFLSDPGSGKILVDHVLRLEDINGGMCGIASFQNFLCKAGCVDYNTTLDTRNAASGIEGLRKEVPADFIQMLASRPYQFWYLDKMRQLVSRQHEADLLNFNYTFE